MNNHILHDRALALAALDATDSERQAAFSHAETCSDCKRELAEADKILQLIDEQLPPPPPAPEVLHQISDQIVRQSMAGHRRQAHALFAMFRPNRAKAWYLSGAVVLQLAAALYASTMLAIGDRPLAWLGAGLALGAVPTRILSYYVYPTPRTSRWMVGLLATAAGGAAIVVAATPVSPVALASALLGAASTVYYVFGYSRFGRQRSGQLEVGAQLPSFMLESYRGEPVSSERYRGTPVVMMFFRGNWCPLCTAQIREIARQYRELHELGVKVALVSPQPHHNAQLLSERFAVPFDFLVDPNAEAARRLGILDEGGLPAGLEILGYAPDTVLPTVIVADGSGRILFSDQTDNYRVRPEPETFLTVLRVARIP